MYRLAALGTAAGTNLHAAATVAAPTTAANAYTNFLAVQAELSNAKVPATGRIAFMTAAYYNFLKQSNFVLQADNAYADRKSGKLGSVDGAEVRVVPNSYMPLNTDLIVTIPDSMVSPMVLADYITHKNPRGVNGWVVEGRVVYDAFVLTAKIDGISTHKTA